MFRLIAYHLRWGRVREACMRGGRIALLACENYDTKFHGRRGRIRHNSTLSKKENAWIKWLIDG